MALPPAVLRGDVGILLTLARFFRAAYKSIKVGPTLQQPFSKLVEEVGVTDPFLLNWLSLLCFLLQGMPPSGTMTVSPGDSSHNTQSITQGGLAFNG